MASTANSSPATCQATFEQGVAISLHLWEALALAVQNNWGGPDSADKRDWFAGAVVELFPDVSRLTPAQLQQKTTTQQQQQQQQAQGSTQHHHQSTSAQNGSGSAEEPDQADVEALLLQVMLDEFEVNVDDESAFEVAEQVVRLRGECLRGKFDGVEAVRRRWEGRKGNKVVFKKAEDQDEDTDWDTDDSDEDEGDDDEGGDVEMGDAPALVATPRRERQEPEVDEDGFTKVTKKKR